MCATEEKGSQKRRGAWFKRKTTAREGKAECFIWRATKEPRGSYLQILTEVVALPLLVLLSSTAVAPVAEGTGLRQWNR